MRPTVWLTLASLGTTGCLSSTYRLAPGELQRVAMTAPEERGRALRVVQRTSFSDDPPTQPVEAMPVAGCYDCGPNIWIGGGVHVGGHAHVGHPAPHRIVRRAPAPASLPRDAGPGTLRATPPGTGGGSPMRATPPRTVYPTAGNTGGGGGGPNLDVKGDKAAAVVIIAAAAAFTVGLVATEGARYDGWVATAPDQPVHLRLGDGGYWSVPLWAIDPSMASMAEEAVLVENEYRGLQMLGRAPLDRKGGVWRMEGGGYQLATMDSTAAKQTSMGGGATMAFGGFPHQMVGILGTVSLGGGTHMGGDVFMARYGLELDVMPLALGPLHLGGYGWGGMSYTSSDGGSLVTQERSRGAGSLGVLGELELTTRLALSLRAGATMELSGDHSGTPLWMFNVGFSVY